MSYLRVTNLWKSYSAGVHGCSARVWALRGCSLHVGSGMRVAILGRGGAGKTTLLQCLAGLRSTDAGRIDADFPLIKYGHARPLHTSSDVPSSTLYIVDDLERADDLESLSPRATVIVSARSATVIAAAVQQVYALREGRIDLLPRTPIRRVAERTLTSPAAPFGTRES